VDTTFGIDYYIGIDGISLLLVVLTGLTPIALSSWEGVERGQSSRLHRSRGGDDRGLPLARLFLFVFWTRC
jgi:hypothetical protein